LSGALPFPKAQLNPERRTYSLNQRHPLQREARGELLNHHQHSKENLAMKRIVLALMAMMFAALPALAQPASGGVGDTGYGYLGAGIGFGLAAGLAALGHGKIASAACEGAARNPGAAGRIQTMMLLGLAFVETCVIFTLLIVFLKVGA
jgi:F-type H+-transporting ATPase subunit c